MDFKEVLTKRRSVRKFLPTIPTREVLEDIVRDALTAPSSRNMHTTRFMIIENRETIDKIAEMRDYGSSFMTGAPAAIPPRPTFGVRTALFRLLFCSSLS